MTSLMSNTSHMKLICGVSWESEVVAKCGVDCGGEPTGACDVELCPLICAWIALIAAILWLIWVRGSNPSSPLARFSPSKFSLDRTLLVIALRACNPCSILSRLSVVVSGPALGGGMLNVVAFPGSLITQGSGIVGAHGGFCCCGGGGICGNVGWWLL